MELLYGTSSRCYAEYLVLIAESEEDLKLQMRILGSYSDEFEMGINPKKTKVMIFNVKNKIPENTVFGLIGNHEIKTTNHYKYLGVTKNNKGSFTEHVANIVNKAQKCIYALLARNREWKGFKPNLFLYLFDHTISPILSYGCEIWGNQDWDITEKLHLFICKFSLGVKASTPTDGVYAELRRYPLKILRHIQMIKFALRVWKLEDTRYVNKALKVLIADDIKGHFNWVSQIINLMKTYDLTSADLSLNLVKNKIIQNFNGTSLDRIKNCGLGKRLRTYNTFKHVIKFEPYFDFIENTSLRKIYNRFRLSSHDLEIERGKYGVKSTPSDERLCTLCDLNEVADEFHFLVICPRYEDERNYVLNDIHESFPSITYLQLRDKFIWLMSQENKSVILKLAYFLKIANEIRITELESRFFPR